MRSAPAIAPRDGGVGSGPEALPPPSESLLKSGHRVGPRGLGTFGSSPPPGLFPAPPVPLTGPPPLHPPQEGSEGLGQPRAEGEADSGSWDF